MKRSSPKGILTESQMRIIVPIKQVPETNAVRMDEATGTMIRDGVEAIVNPLDLYAIEVAIRLRETYGGDVLAISMGPAKAAAALREAIAMGVDSGVLVSDAAFAGSDTWATSCILAEAIKSVGMPDLVVCGERATDGDTGQVGPGIAAFLDLPVVTYVSRIEAVDAGEVTFQRLVEDGYEVVSARLPAVITVVKEASDPRLPTLRGKQKARKAVIPVLDHTKLGIDPAKVGLAGSPTRVVRIFRPKVSRQCVVSRVSDEASLGSAVDGLLELLSQRRIL
jgi:electron transfer flavoprotein beta subunit